jgi:ubiquinone/menaquinone biosynthesis C-methylase UbiE
VAGIVSPEWWNETDRDAADESGQLARALDIRPGMAVADIGAGAGYHTLRLAKRVGPSGRIYANDITPNYLADLKRTAERRKIRNVEFVLGGPDDPRLPPASVDRAILVHMYHEIAQPYAMLANLAPALKPGGKVGVVDLDRPTQNHGTPPALLRCEFEAMGYRQERVVQLRGDVGYLAIFTPPPPGAAPQPGSVKPCALR